MPEWLSLARQAEVFLVGAGAVDEAGALLVGLVGQQRIGDAAPVREGVFEALAPLVRKPL
jgi:hypothetical protein